MRVQARVLGLILIVLSLSPVKAFADPEQAVYCVAETGSGEFVVTFFTLPASRLASAEQEWKASSLAKSYANRSCGVQSPGGWDEAKTVNGHLYDGYNPIEIIEWRPLTAAQPSPEGPHEPK
jgi:hypothetical protein